ncbi:HAMP domain-containing sensor histidine kinase [Persicobacter diffluens]|uniref:histidine kinase n=1 Tax=Persicobacter diffluens TaxID=981 RepID=A0AAN5ANX5_9BACT|nr:hypothetical protein PEDI_43130 [Persicobacter diffluens]
MSKLYSVIFCAILCFAFIDKRHKADELNTASEGCFYDNPEESGAFAHKALQVAMEADYSTEIVRAYVNLSRQYNFVGNYSRALDSLYQAVGYINEIPETLANQLLLSISQTHISMNSDSLTLDQYIALRNTEVYLVKNYSVLMDLSDYYTNHYNYFKANDNLQKALVFAQTLQDTGRIAQTQLKIGALAQNIQRYDRVPVYLAPALRYFQQQADSSQMAYILGLWADSQYELNHTASADSLYLLALHYSKPEHGNYYHMLINMAKVNSQQGKNQLALDFYQNALQVMQGNYNAEKACVFNAIGKLQLSMKAFTFSKNSFDSALWYARKYHDFENLEIALVGKADIAEINGNFELAVELIRNSKIAQQRSNEQKEIDAIARSNAYFDNRFKDLQIVDLRQDKYVKNLMLDQQQTKNDFLLLILFAFIFGVALLMLWLVQLRKNTRLVESNAVMIKAHNQELMAINEMLGESQEELLRANGIKDRMFSIIGHDAKGPLINIRNQIYGILSNPQLDRSLLLELQQAEGAVDSVIMLINDLLNWALMQGQKIVPRNEVVDFHSIVEENIRLYEKLIQNKQLEVHYPDFSGVKLISDVQMLSFCLRNLLSNAVKFTPQKGRIKIDFLEREEDVLIQLMDSGAGMSEAQLAEVFSPSEGFYPVGAKAGGVGFGLPMTARFVESLGGEISGYFNEEGMWLFEICLQSQPVGQPLI